MRALLLARPKRQQSARCSGVRPVGQKQWQPGCLYQGPHRRSLTMNAASCVSLHALRLRAFTLIELLGVLAVIALLAGALVPALIRQMDRIAGHQESAALKSLSSALQQSIRRNHYIPNHTDWASTVAT